MTSFPAKDAEQMKGTLDSQAHAWEVKENAALWRGKKTKTKQREPPKNKLKVRGLLCNQCW